ncbi:DUF2231 domain-containing protein [Aestuariivirga litoralis]|uniref:DUF2231 domain-containing protein n=1 Tax=Aestuariivirga litoralis TaxID=2650924 RepID=UPI0018C55EF1|nr:DUF2231 domain-containing protein [Aestuariivirga litoralis]MBG1231497.1 hypothetical protein [Aestuariivirga litoralis]
MIPVQHIHPMIVHFPIVLVFLLLGFDTIASFMGKSITGRTVAGNLSLTLALLAAASAIAAFVFGGMALDVAESTGFHSDVAEMHESLGTAVAVAFTAYAVVRALLWWLNVRLTGASAFTFAIVALVGCALVSATAFYGGQLVYELGVNVTRVALN